MTESVDCIVIGAGVVGLAVARRLAMAGKEVIVLESEDTIGTQTSSRNSEVIHAGIYYPTGSLKARTCVAGKHRLYRYCASHGVPHSQLGKLIVATSELQIETLHQLKIKAAANGSLRDGHSVLNGPGLKVRQPFVCFELVNPGLQLCALVFNGLNPKTIPDRYLARGCYFTISGKPPFQRLIYPVPEPGGLGVHVTLDMGGGIRFGPDVEWIDHVDYEIKPERADSFYSAIRKYYPELKDGTLQPGYAGVRPKITEKGSAAGDFLIQGPEEHKIKGLVNMYGIESPGLTASLALADIVAHKLGLPEIQDGTT